MFDVSQEELENREVKMDEREEENREEHPEIGDTVKCPNCGDQVVLREQPEEPESENYPHMIKDRRGQEVLSIICGKEVFQKMVDRPAWPNEEDVEDYLDRNFR